MAAGSTARSTTRSRSRRSSPTCRASRSSSRRRPMTRPGCCVPRIRDDDPVLFFEHKKMYRSVRGDVPADDYVVPLGKAAITHPGTQITVIAYGLMAHYALEAADVVADEGISVEVVDLRTLRPARQGDRPLVRPEDRQVPGRLRGQPLPRLRRGDLLDHRRGGVRLPRRPGHAHRRPGCPRRPVQPRPRGLVHGQPREDRRRHPQARGLLGAAAQAPAGPARRSGARWARPPLRRPLGPPAAQAPRWARPPRFPARVRDRDHLRMRCVVSGRRPGIAITYAWGAWYPPRAPHFAPLGKLPHAQRAADAPGHLPIQLRIRG